MIFCTQVKNKKWKATIIDVHRNYKRDKKYKSSTMVPVLGQRSIKCVISIAVSLASLVVQKIGCMH